MRSVHPGRNVLTHTLVTTLWLAAVAASAAAAPVGGNIGFLRDAPITRFTGPDLAMFRSNVGTALEKTADGDTHRWQNPKTGSAGEIELVGSFEQDGKRCRRTRITNRARGYADDRTDAVFCRQADGQWRILPPPARPAGKPADQ